MPGIFLHLSRRLFFVPFIIGWLLCTGAAHADVDISRPVPADGGPTSVKCQVFAMDIDEVDNANETLTVNLFYRLKWRDPRLVHEGGEVRHVPLDEVWHPNIQLVNQQRVFETLPKSVSVSPDGTVSYLQRVWGPFSQRFDLRQFPFDQQRFDVVFAAAGMQAGDVVIEPDLDVFNGVAEDVSLQDWDFTAWDLESGFYEPVPAGPQIPALIFTVDAKREAKYYIIKVIIPLLMILVMASIVFWIDPKEASVRIGVSTSAMLTLIAYRFAVGADLPKIPYLTRMDFFILVSTLMVAFALVEVVMTSHFAKNDRVNLARRIDTVMRILYPGLVIAVSLWSVPWATYLT